MNTLNHLIHNLTGVCFRARGHFQPVQPALGVLSDCTLQSHIPAAAVAYFLESADYRFGVCNAARYCFEIN